MRAYVRVRACNRHKRKERETNGIVIDATSWQQLVETAEDVGLDNSEIPSLLPQALN